MHTIQKLLIKRLIKENNQRYSTLTKGFDSDDNVVFHLKQLQSLGLITKAADIYTITFDGIKKTQEFDINNLSELIPKPLVIGFVCEYEGKYILKTHDNAKEPYFNLPNGRPYHNAKLQDELKRILNEELGSNFTYEPMIFDSLHMKDVTNTEGKLIFSDAFVVYNVKLKQIGDLQPNMKLLSIEEIEKLDNRWNEVDMCILRKEWKIYSEYFQISNYVL